MSKNNTGPPSIATINQPYPAIDINNLSKSFGSIAAVQNLTLKIELGEIFGFLGPNGAGKSTTIKLLLDEIRPTRGSARIFGLDTHRDMLEIHGRIGYLPGEFRMPTDLTGSEFLTFLSRIRGGTDPAYLKELLDRLGLDPTRPLRQLSSGNKQKVGLIQAFMTRPDLVLLDEPTSGLDPLVQHDFHEMLADLSASGTTVLLSSHTLSEVDRVAGRVGIIRSGQLVTVERVDVLKDKARHNTDLEFSRHPTPGFMETANGVRRVTYAGNTASVTYEGSIDPLLRAALHAGTVEVIRTPEVDLEEVFLSFYRNGS